MRSGVGRGSANQWADKEKNEEQFAYDAELEAEKWLKANLEVDLEPNKARLIYTSNDAQREIAASV